MPSNLTQVWWNDDRADLLAINGFSEQGSDYDRFRRFCICLDRDPKHPLAKQSQQLLQALFGIQNQLNEQNAPDIWQLTADRLLLGSIKADVLQQARAGVQNLFVVPQMSRQLSAVGVEGLDLPTCRTWQAWRMEAEAVLDAGVVQGMTPALTLPPDFRAVMPNLYQVEQHLKGEVNDRDLSLSQLAFFMLGYARERKLRPLLITHCSAAEVKDLLTRISRLTPIPCFAWQTEQAVELHTLAALCRMIQPRPQEGTPPITLLTCP